jgi:integrase
MEPMPRSRLPYLLKEIARGKTFWYFRRGKGLRVRIHGEYGSAEFTQNYLAALNGDAPKSRPVAASGTLGWLIDAYKGSSAWERLSPYTKVQRSSTYKAVIARAGDAPLNAITAKTIRKGIEDRAKTPFAANDFLKAMRALFSWAKRAQHVEIDPTEGVKGFPQKTEGFHVWTDEEIARFEARWPIGTRERLAFAVLLYTGMRRGDASTLGRQHIKDGTITFRTQKTGQQVTIPVLPKLAAVINATKTGDLALIATQDGHAMSPHSFGHWFQDACKAAGLPGRAHGLRKACATRFAEHGCTEEELKGWFGWSDGRMASVYTRKANRGKLAIEAAKKLAK